MKKSGNEPAAVQRVLERASHARAQAQTDRTNRTSRMVRISPTGHHPPSPARAGGAGFGAPCASSLVLSPLLPWKWRLRPEPRPGEREYVARPETGRARPRRGAKDVTRGDARTRPTVGFG